VRQEVKGKGGAFEKLEAATGSLWKEREFFDALMQAKPVAEVVNRIVFITTLYQGADRYLSAYLARRADALFLEDPAGVSSVLSFILGDISRAARLAAYLSVKGLAPQAVSALRPALEQIGVYCHIWRDPAKYRFALETDSDEYGRAFRHAPPQLQTQLRERDVKYRFMHCRCAQSLSKLYDLISNYFVHGSGLLVSRDEGLSCEFVDRSKPEAMVQAYGIAQMLLCCVLVELFASIPADDLLDEDAGAFSLVAGLFVPLLSATPGKEDPELKAMSDRLLAAIAQLRPDEP
jgi:hypothetical protein